LFVGMKASKWTSIAKPGSVSGLKWFAIADSGVLDWTPQGLGDAV